ncbi:MAG: ribonuclease P protein component [Bacteroidetes bacterium 4572_112]|nr:MAG: ribonuclease P protein component [Bacteroidetes bacterium 4572_112]
MNQGLTKAERINSNLTIEDIFRNGNSVFSYPYRLVWIENKLDEDIIPSEILLSVGKKRFKKAVDRNAIKRLIRESYRINKNVIWEYCKENNLKLQMGIVYVGKEISDFDSHNKAMKKLIEKLLNSISKVEK